MVAPSAYLQLFGYTPLWGKGVICRGLKVPKREVLDCLGILYTPEEATDFMRRLYSPPGDEFYGAPQLREVVARDARADKLLVVIRRLSKLKKVGFLAFTLPILDRYLRAGPSVERAEDVHRVLGTLAGYRSWSFEMGVNPTTTDRTRQLFIDLAQLKYGERRADRSALFLELHKYTRSSYGEFGLAPLVAETILTSPMLERTIMFERLLLEINHPTPDIRHLIALTIREAIINNTSVRPVAELLPLLVDMTHDESTMFVAKEAMLALAVTLFEHPDLMDDVTEDILRERGLGDATHSNVALISALALNRAKRGAVVDVADLAVRAIEMSIHGSEDGRRDHGEREAAARVVVHVKGEAAQYITDEQMEAFIGLLRPAGAVFNRPPEATIELIGELVRIRSDMAASVARRILTEKDRQDPSGSWTGDDITFATLIGILAEFDPKNVSPAWVQRLMNMLKKDNRVVRSVAARPFGIVAAQPEYKDLLVDVWGELGPQSVVLRDGGRTITTLPGFMREFLRQQSAFPSRITIHDVPVRRRRISLGEFLKENGVFDTPRKFGYSTAYPVRGSQDVLVLKYLKPEQSPEDLIRELKVFHRIHEHGLTFGNILPRPVTDDASNVELLMIDKRTAVAYRVHSDYFKYLSNGDLDENSFRHGLVRAMKGIFGMARHGFYHTVPIQLFHNRERIAISRHTGDHGQYTVSPDIAFNMNRGMGRLDDWPGSILYSNYGALGWRDGEEVFTLDELIGPYSDRVPQFARLANMRNSAPVYGALLLGNHLLAATLMIGNRVHMQADSGNDRHFWRDPVRLRPVSDLLQGTFAEAYAALHAVDAEVAYGMLGSKADWRRFARQIAFFMTRAYVDFVRVGADAGSFPLAEVYGEDLNMNTVMGPYRKGSFDDEIGYVGPSGDPSKASLGPVNGPFPILEFEKAMYSVFIPPQYVGISPRALKLSI